MSPSRRAAPRSAERVCSAVRAELKSPFAAATATAEVSPAKAAGTAASSARRCVPRTPATLRVGLAGIPGQRVAAAGHAHDHGNRGGGNRKRRRDPQRASRDGVRCAVDRGRASTAVGAVSRRSSRNRMPTSAALGRSAGSAAVMSVSSARQPTVDPARDRRRAVQPSHRRRDAGAGERDLAGQRLDEHQPERVDVAGRCDLVTGGLLRAEVVRGSERGADDGEPGAVEQPRDAEVGELGASPARRGRAGSAARWPA